MAHTPPTAERAPSGFAACPPSLSAQSGSARPRLAVRRMFPRFARSQNARFEQGGFAPLSASPKVSKLFLILRHSHLPAAPTAQRPNVPPRPFGAHSAYGGESAERGACAGVSYGAHSAYGGESASGFAAIPPPAPKGERGRPESIVRILCSTPSIRYHKGCRKKCQALLDIFIYKVYINTAGYTESIEPRANPRRPAVVERASVRVADYVVYRSN
jgi:hypothetical protein